MESEGRGTKFLGTDFGRKYILAEIDERPVCVSFYSGFLKGVYDVEIWVEPINKQQPTVKIKAQYPALLRRVREALLLVQQAMRYRREKREAWHAQ